MKNLFMRSMSAFGLVLLLSFTLFALAQGQGRHRQPVRRREQVHPLLTPPRSM